MPTQVQFRRGTEVQNNNFTGGVGEISINETNNSIRIHDGSTAGGFEVAKADLSNVSGVTTFSTNSVSIGITEVISGSRELKNIVSLDSTTIATIEGAISSEPNDFSSLNVSGITTLSTAGVTDLTSSQLNVSGITTLSTAGVTDLTSSQLNVSGIVTATGGFISVGNTTPIQISLEGNQLIFTAVGIGSTTLTLV